MALLTSAPPTGRVGRYPKHTFAIQELPYTMQPFMIAPVLPGETLANLKFEARSITDPIVSPIIGWKKEFHFFYVRVTDLLSDSIRDMFVDPTNADLSGTLGIAANDQAHYTAKGGIDYLKRSLSSIWTHYFSDQDDVLTDYDTAATSGMNGLPFVQIRDRFWLDSITDDDVMPTGGAVSGATTFEQLEAMQAAYENLRALGIANMTYHDFLRSYGINVPNPEEHKPEHLAKFTDFTYPSNTVNPATGAPVSACSWVFNNSVRDPKMFKEPGFVVGVSITRPKVYFTGLAGNLAAHLTRAWDWLPNYLNEAAADPMPFTSLKKFTADTGPLGDRTTATDGYFVDMRDLFLYGDQFHNMAAFNPVPANLASINGFALPPGDNHHLYKYPTEAMVKNLFVTPATAYTVRTDGYTSLSIKGKQIDYTLGNVAEQ